MRSLSSCLVLLLGLAPLSCADGDSGLSVAQACDVYSDKWVECFSDDPVNDDNIKSAAITACEGGIAELEDINPDNRECHQAVRRFYQCSGVEPTCEELEAEDLMSETCETEIFDLLEFCDNLTT
jgi:hypothetical protein